MFIGQKVVKFDHSFNFNYSHSKTTILNLVKHVKDSQSYQKCRFVFELKM